MYVGESMEDYLETILILDEKTGFVRSIDIATQMGFSKPSISNAMKKLRENGYITVEEKGKISLTELGRQIANHTYERHKVISAMLISLGVPEEIAMEDACRMEHVISDETFSHIKQHYLQALAKKEE